MVSEKVVLETKKLIEAGFIREEENADWIASIVPVKKKNGQIRICAFNLKIWCVFVYKGSNVTAVIEKHHSDSRTRRNN